MEHFAIYSAKKISLSLGYTQEKEQVITYGLIAMIQFLSILLIITIIGFLGSFTYESILIFLGVGILRKSTGGAHSNTMRGCTIESCLCITLLAFTSRYILIFSNGFHYYIFFYVVIYTLCFYIVYKYVPMDSPNKKITSNKKISRLRKQSFKKLIIYFIVGILLSLFSNQFVRFQSLANSICLLTLWQCFTVTPTGAKMLYRIDRLF